MFSLNYKIRRRLLYFGLLLFLVLVYKLALAKTFEQRKYYQNSYEAHARVSSLSQKTVELKQKMVALDKLIGGEYKVDSFQSYLVGRVNLLTKQYNIILKSYKEPDSYPFQNYLIDTYQIELSGAYKDLLEFIHHIEVSEPLGKLISVRFNVQEDKKSKEQSLVALLYLQTTKKIKDEN